MTEMEAIRVRHSVRTYQSKKIEQEKVNQLKALIDEVNAAGNLHLQFMEDAGKSFRRILSKVMGLDSAPSVIACVGPDDDTLDERIGYYGEKIVLAAQCMGLNTCWAGTFNKSGVPAEIGDGERLVIVIAIGYGENQGKQRKSKTPEQVSYAKGTRPDWFDFGVEMALCAPTAINQQSFEIRLNEDGSVDFIDKGGPFSRVDLGIVKYHFTAGAAYKKNDGVS
ncbi:MAG: nitroreductase [Clostridiales bacterium]|nr:nitroreductase [Candidatus Cacconaster stercorequi]